jgi:hypothetical protein
MKVLAKVPRPALAALLSIRGVDTRLAVAQLKELAAQDVETSTSCRLDTHGECCSSDKAPQAKWQNATCKKALLNTLAG